MFVMFVVVAYQISRCFDDINLFVGLYTVVALALVFPMSYMY